MRFEQLVEGATYETREKEITDDEIVRFATDYDHQPLHLDPEFAADGPFGGLIASGFHTLAVAWNLWMTHGVMESDGRGGIGLEGCRWHEPVFAGDRLRARVTIGELRLTRKDHGFIRMDFEVLNQHDRIVLEFRTSGIQAREEDDLSGASGVRQ